MNNHQRTDTKPASSSRFNICLYRGNRWLCIFTLFMRNRIHTLSFCFLLLFLIRGTVFVGLSFAQTGSQAVTHSLIHHPDKDDAEKNTEEAFFSAEEYIHVAVIIATYPPVKMGVTTKTATTDTRFRQQVFLSAPEPPPDSYLL